MDDVWRGVQRVIGETVLAGEIQTMIDPEESLSWYGVGNRNKLALNVVKTPELEGLRAQVEDHLAEQYNVPVDELREFDPHIVIASVEERSYQIVKWPGRLIDPSESLPGMLLAPIGLYRGQSHR